MRSIQELMDLSGKVALVTGGAGHIGRAAAETLVELGARVVLIDRDLDLRSPACLAISALEDVSMLACDVADEVSLRGAVDKILSLEHRLDIVVHSAAYVGTTDVSGWSEPFEYQSAEAFEAAMTVNVIAAFVLAQQAKPALVDSKGCIILLGSIYGMVGPDSKLYQGTSMQNPIGYGASKGAVLQLVRSLATTMAPVRVNAISPGGVFRNQPEAFVERYVSRTPLGRMATEEDVKGAIAFLASDLSAYVTGHNLVVDGGWLAW